MRFRGPVSRFRSWLRWCIGTAGLLGALTATGQQVFLDQFNTQDGLPQNIIKTLTVDSLGYLWVGTGKGLARFDGHEFQTLAAAEGLPDAFITAAYLAPDQHLWLGHFGGYVSRVDPQQGIAVPQRAQGDQVVAVGPGPGGHTWALQQDGLVVRDDSVQWPLPDKPTGLIRTAAWHAPDRLVVGTETGLIVYRFTAQEFQRDTVLTTAQQAADVYTSNGRLFVYRPNVGVDILALDESRWIWFPVVPATQLEGEVVQLFQDQQDYLWIATERALRAYAPPPFNIWYLTLRLGPENGLPEAPITAMEQGRNGDLWIGTFGEGLFRLPANFVAHIGEAHGLPGPRSTCVYQDQDFTTYIGSATSLSWYRGATFLDAEAPLDLTVVPTGFPVTSVVEFPQGNILVGSGDGGVFRLLPEKRALEPYAVPTLSPEASINSLNTDRNGHLWINTATEGTFRVDAQGNVTNFSTANGLLHNSVSKVYADQRGNTWFLAEGTGLACLSGDAFTYYTQGEGLATTDITSITEDDSGTVWIGTLGDGLYALQEGTWQQYTTEQGLVSNECLALLPAVHGGLWVLSDNALSHFYPAIGSTHHERFPALRGLEFTNKAAISGLPHLALMASNLGVTRVFLAHQTPPLPHTVLTGWHVSGERFTLQAAQELPYARHRLRFDFRAIAPPASRDVRFQYRLLGYDRDWLPATNEQFADYTGLKEGAYTFEVRSVMGDQASAPARFSFSVATPFWKTWWFFAALTVLAISAVYAVIAWRTYRLRRAKKQLEYEVALRTEKIRKQNEELEHFTYIVSHDLKTPVFNIGGLIEMLQATNLPPDQHRDEIFEMMHESTNHLKHNLERLMEVIKARDSGNEPTQTIRFEKLIREVMANTHILIRDAGAQVHLDLKVAEVTYNRSNLYSLLYNLLTNAIKYRSPERTPEVHIRTWKAEGFIGLSLSDNGLGIDLERDGEKLFGMFQRIHQQGEGTGIGLHLVKTMIENSGGHLTVESEVGKGTTFHAALVPEGNN